MHLIEAINTNKLSNVAAAVAAGEDVNKPVFGITPLYKAVTEAKSDIVAFLLAHGADWSKRDRNSGFTPLMAASLACVASPAKYVSRRAIRESREVVEALRSAGATDPETKNILGNESDEDALLEAIARLKPSPDALVENCGGAVVLVSPRMKRKWAAFAPYLDTLRKFAYQRRLTRVLQELPPPQQ